MEEEMNFKQLLKKAMENKLSICINDNTKACKVVNVGQDFLTLKYIITKETEENGSKKKEQFFENKHLLLSEVYSFSQGKQPMSQHSLAQTTGS